MTSQNDGVSDAIDVTVMLRFDEAYSQNEKAVCSDHYSSLLFVDAIN